MLTGAIVKALAAPEQTVPFGAEVTQETSLAELPKVTTEDFAFIGTQGLNVKVGAGRPVVAGQPILDLVAVPTDGRHYLAAQSTRFDNNRVYRITAWVKAPAGLKVQLEVRDGINSRNGKPANYGVAIFDPTTRSVSTSSTTLKGRGIEQGPDQWQKIWVDLATADGQFVLALGVADRDGKTSFKGNGRLG